MAPLLGQPGLALRERICPHKIGLGYAHLEPKVVRVLGWLLEAVTSRDFGPMIALPMSRRSCARSKGDRGNQDVAALCRPILFASSGSTSAWVHMRLAHLGQT